MLKKITLTIAVFALVFTASAQTTLTYNLKVGEEYTVAQRAVQTITQEIPGMTQVIENDLKGTMVFKVMEVKKDTTILEMSFSQFALKMSSPQHGVMMNVDTAVDNPESTEHLMFKGMLNQPITIKMLNTGKIAEVLNGEAIIEGMIDGLGMDDPGVREQMYAQLGKEWSGDALAKSFEQMTYNYTDTPVNIGDTWNNEFKGEGKINANNTWTLAAIDGDNAAITGDASITMDLTNPQINMVLKGSQQTTIATALGSGFPKSIEVTSNAQGDATSPAMPGQTIPTTLASKTTYILQ